MVTMETVAKALKTVYLGAIIEELNLKTDPFIARIHTSTDHVYGTNEIVRAAQIGLNGGFGAGTETGELPQPGEDVYANLRSTTKNLYGVIQMSDKSLKSFKGNDKNAFGNMIQRQIDSMVREFEYRLSSQGLKLDDFLKYTGSDMTAFREQYRAQAIKSVKAHLVLEAIEKAEGIDATEEQVDEQIAQFAPQTGKTVEELKAQLTEADREYFKADAIRDNCVKFLCDSAVAE
jgi:hypothetical protein